ncbi:MAG: hypothetical protein E7294_00935 [Lachnospiraceae bacterium]|jgi:RNA polymerase primary sigma factor|nr:hypothetical protein [Lachnospiraceae bacterium]
MNQEIIFRRQLEEIVKTARKQGMYLAKEQVREEFPELVEKEDKLELVYQYLKGQHITVGEGEEPQILLSDEDQYFLDRYLEEIKEKAQVDPEEKTEIILAAMAESEEAKQRLIEIYLPDVAEIARLYTGQGVYLEDLIGEGNVALLSVIPMLTVLEDPAEADGFVGKFLMDAMEKFLQEEENSKELDEQVLAKVNDVAQAAKKLYEELRRKVTVEELANESGMTPEQITEAVRACGDQIEEIETGQV